MLLAGLDIGTTGCKIGVYQENGRYLGKAYREYAAPRTRSGHEADGLAIWNAVREAIGEAAAKYPGIGGIGVASFGETFVLLGGRDEPICPSMLCTDPRGETESRELREKLGDEAIALISGLAPHAMYSLPKLMWLKRNRPEQYAAARRIMLIGDYIVYMLTGAAKIDYSLASRTMGFDIRRLDWSDEIFGAAEIDPALFSNPVPPGAAAGCVKPRLAEQWGMGKGATVVSAGHDQVAAAVGSGVFDESCAVGGAGTAECVTPVFEKADWRKMAAGGYAAVPYVLPGKYVSYAFSYTGGALVKWFISELAGDAKIRAAERNESIHELLECGWKGAPTGLLVLPHFAGAATPYMDAGSRGVIAGLALASTRQDIYLACMEGVCYEMRLNLEHLRGAGVAVRHLRAAGGGANSRVWLQMKADILDVPVTALVSEEAGATGGAMFAGVALGVFGNLERAARVFVSEKETFFPRAGARERYAEIYERYRKLYGAVRPLL
ncbi:MAG: carbohydrate kinase [Clostridiales bacterium]|jgi:xylulokinase|nr:carbohydrate kinase [Clostridiales bacterium]